jgi:hypothetical protein
MLRSVDLPQPEGPSRLTNSPGPMSKLMLSSTGSRLPSRAEKLRLNPSTQIGCIF